MYKKISDFIFELLRYDFDNFKSGNLYAATSADEYKLTNLGVQLTHFLTKNYYGVSYCITDVEFDNCEFNKNQLYCEFLDKEYFDTMRRPRLDNFIKLDIDEIYNILLEIPKDSLIHSLINNPNHYIDEDLIIVDGFHNISVSEEISDSKYEYITKRLKDLAIEKEIPILILHKINNEKKDLDDEGIYKQYYSKIVDLDRMYIEYLDEE